MNNDEVETPNPKLKIQRKHKTQNLKVDYLINIFEFGNLYFLWILDLVILGYKFYIYSLFFHFLTKIGRRILSMNYC